MSEENKKPDTVEEVKTEETKPEDAKAEETKSEETKTEDTKSDEAKSEEVKTEEEAAPAADEIKKASGKDKKTSKKNKIMIGAIIGLVAIIIALIAVILGKGGSKDDDYDTSEPSVEAASDNDAVSEDLSTEGGEATTEAEKDKTQDGSVTATITNQWESNGKFCGQLDLSIANTASSEMKDWKIEIDVPEGTAIDSNWNCVCEINGGKLIVQGADYNVTVPANGKVSDIGIILSANSQADLNKLTESPRLYVGGKLYTAQGSSTSEDSTEEATTEVADNAGNGGTNNGNNSTNNNNNGNSTTQPSTPAASESGTPYANHGKLSVSGVNLVDASGNKYQLKGVSTHGIAWFPEYVNEDAFRTIRDDWGANVIRIAMYSGENNGYCTGGDKEQLKALVDKGVQAATNLGMYVIIDWHVLGDLNPQVYKEEAKKFFEEMSAKYKNYGNVIYEICNEPNGGTPWSDVKSYAEEVIPIIKANCPDAVIIVGTPNWAQDVDTAASDPVTGYSNIMYALHFYAATHTDWLRNKASTALSSGIPLFVSEFSICDASGNGAIDYNQAQAWLDFVNSNNISYVSWSLSNKNETSALISSSCTKTSGWTDSDLSEAGKWLKKALKGN